MTLERIAHSGAYHIYSMVNGRLFSRTYYGYTRREAIAQYRHDRKVEKSKPINEVG